MNYEPQEFVGGKWAKNGEIVSKKAKILNEVKPAPGRFLNEDGTAKMQDVAKVSFQGLNEPLNVNLNKATISGLVKAFGKDSTAWMNKVLDVVTEKMRVAGKQVTALYLIAEGYELMNDSERYAKIVRAGDESEQLAPEEEVPVIQQDDEETINLDSVPF